MKKKKYFVVLQLMKKPKNHQNLGYFSYSSLAISGERTKSVPERLGPRRHDLHKDYPLTWNSFLSFFFQC